LFDSDPERAAELGRKSGKCRRSADSEFFALPPPRSAGDLHRALSEIFSKVSSGEMHVRLGRTLGYIASALVRTAELSDHEIRLRAIEQMIGSIESGGDT
jgi:hypothetical protein